MPWLKLLHIGAVVVWRVRDTAQAAFDVEDYGSYVQLQTESALRQLIARYSDAVIRNDADAWIATWAEDGRWSMAPGKVVEGREAIRTTWVTAMKGFNWVVHTPGVCVFEVNEQPA